MKVILLDTAFAAAPIYNYLVSAGHDVWTMGNRPNDLLARQAGSRWIEQDYSDPAVVEQYIADIGIEAIVPGCTDVSIETCLVLSVGAQFRDSPAVNVMLSNKALFRELCEELGLLAPHVVDSSTFPMPGHFICKPVDAFSGRGITIFDGEDIKSLADALLLARSASASGQAILETFVSGQLYSCSGFVVSRTLSDMFFVREGASANPFAVDTSHLSYDIPPSCSERLREDINRICGHLNLKNGLLHVQFILSDGLPYIVEVARRCPGDLYPLLIEYSTGFEYAARYAASFLGQDHRTQVRTRRHILRHTVTADRNSYYEGLMFQGRLPVYAFYPISLMGDLLKERQGNRAGLVFCEEGSEEDLIILYDRFLKRQAYNTTNM